MKCLPNLYSLFLSLQLLWSSVKTSWRETPSTGRMRKCVCSQWHTERKGKEGRELGISHPCMQTSRKLHPPTFLSFIRQELVSVLLVSISVLQHGIHDRIFFTLYHKETIISCSLCVIWFLINLFVIICSSSASAPLVLVIPAQPAYGVDSPCGSATWQPGNCLCLMFQTGALGRKGGSFCPQPQDISLSFIQLFFSWAVKD